MSEEYLGIDPGLSGGFTLITRGRVSLMLAMPTIKTTSLGGQKTELDTHGIASFLKLLPCDVRVAIEDQPPVRNQNIVSTCTTQRNYGVLRCALALSNRDYTVVTPAEWQSHFGIIAKRGEEGKTTKQQASELAQSRFPNTDFRASHRAKKPHEGIVDACLIGLYLAEKEQEAEVEPGGEPMQ